MAFLTIAGRTYTVVKSGATEEQPEKIGQRRRSFSGGMRSGERFAFRKMHFTLLPIGETQYQQLVTDTALSKHVVCSGEFSNGVALMFVVDIASADYYRPSVTMPMYRSVTVELTQAE